MHEFIRSISSRLSNPGLSPRAVTLFTQAMTRGRYHWGRKAKLTAGASIAIALRESRKPGSIRDIAFIIDEPHKSLNRAFTNVVTLLQLDVPPADPALHLTTLQIHLQSLIESTSSPPPLPTALLKLLSPLSLPSVLVTATSLCTLLNRLTSTLTHQSTVPTSCAILILALEAEARTSLPHIGVLAQHLAARFNLGKGIVMARYKILYDLVEEWINEVPWLDKFESKGKEKGRSKLAKRIVVARGIKDVIQFQEEIWRKKLEAQGRLNLELDTDPADDDDRSDDDTLSTTTGSSLNSMAKRGLQEPRSSTVPTHKKRKTKHRDLDDASHFLLDPLNAVLPAIGTSRLPSLSPGSNSPSHPCRSTIPPHLPLMSYLLSASPTSLSLSHQPTRLQLLTAERAGGAEDISDEELFQDGELEGFFRSESEVQDLRDVLGWDQADPEGLGTTRIKAPKAKTVRTNRVDMEALAKVLGNDSLGDDDNEDKSENEDGVGSQNQHSIYPAGLEEVEDWRPLSPDNGRGPYDSTDRYDQEY